MNEIVPIIGVALSFALGYVSLLFKRNHRSFGELITELNRTKFDLEVRQRDLQTLNHRLDELRVDLIRTDRALRQLEARLHGSTATPESLRTRDSRESASQKCDSEPARSGRTRFERV